jgi:hypothetical protein
MVNMEMMVALALWQILLLQHKYLQCHMCHPECSKIVCNCSEIMHYARLNG